MKKQFIVVRQITYIGSAEQITEARKRWLEGRRAVNGMLIHGKTLVDDEFPGLEEQS